MGVQGEDEDGQWCIMCAVRLADVQFPPKGLKQDLGEAFESYKVCHDIAKRSILTSSGLWRLRQIPKLSSWWDCFMLLA